MEKIALFVHHDPGVRKSRSSLPLQQETDGFLGGQTSSHGGGGTQLGHGRAKRRVYLAAHVTAHFVIDGILQAHDKRRRLDDVDLGQLG